MKNKHLILMTTLLIIAACRSAPPEKKVTKSHPESPRVTRVEPKRLSVAARQIANEQGTDQVTEFHYQEGSAELSSEAKRLMRQEYESAQEQGEIKQVQVITWGDKNYPAADKGQLAQAQQDLVEERNQSIRDYLSQLDERLDLSFISMAERPGRWDRFMASDETAVQKSLEDFSIPKTGDDSGRSKNARSIVIFLPEP
jgi:hypothetical protein